MALDEIRLCCWRQLPLQIKRVVNGPLFFCLRYIKRMHLRKRLLLSMLAAGITAGTANAAPQPAQSPQATVQEQQPVATRNSDSSTAAAIAETEQSLAFKSLEQLEELSKIGLSGLALRLAEQQQQVYPEFSPDWYAFEFKRIQTMSSLERWQDIIDRVDMLLAKAVPGKQITQRIANWFKTQRAMAMLKLGDAEQALHETRVMLWQGKGEDRDLTAFWRRLIIRAYLELDYADDAHKGLLKYRQDYGDYKTDWKLLQAQAQLRANRPDEVIELLADEESHKANALRLLASVRARPDNAASYIKDIKAQLANENLTQAQQRAYYYVLYEAYLTRQDPVSAAETAERLLALSRTHVVLGENFTVSADDLWDLYAQIGERSGNQYNLLTGDDIAWYKRAGDIEKKQPVQARGMYAVIAFTTRNEAKRQLAHKEIADSLSLTDGGLEVVNQLYMQSSRAGSTDHLPVDVRYRLVDHALSVGDITLAATMMSSLPQPPAGEGYFDWQIRKARVLILEGEHEQGEAVLKSSLQNIDELNADMVDRYLQVVFDLQTIRRHEQALELFDLLPIEAMEDKLRREIYYWKAESNYELEQYDQAAMLYMKSARVGDETMSDLWAQSARFKASDALLKARLYDDAEYAYAELMKITSSDSRKRLIRQKLQHIQLLRNSAADSTRG
jgi:type IV pilus biogenesis protein CpaD/CtpE